MRQNTFEFGPKVDLTVPHAIVQRLNAYAVPSQDQSPFRGNPDRNGKHAAKTGKTISAPTLKCVENNLGVAGCHEAESFGYQGVPQVAGIENLTVENNRDVAIRAEKRLIAVLQVNDPQAGRTQRHLWALKD